MLASFRAQAPAAFSPSAPAASPLPAALGARTQRTLLYALLALGTGLRLYHFIDNRSFFIDELLLNGNILKLGFKELITGPFAYEQKAPLGYLWAARLCVVLFGPHEMALRLFPLLCGLGALFGFVLIARYFLRAWGVVLAVGIVALAYPIVYHAVEAKQYSTELFVSILILGLYVRFKDRTSLAALLAWGVAGGVLLWFSFPAIFMLAGVGGAVGLPALWRRDWRRLALFLVPAALWLVSFGLLYHFFVGKYHDSGWLTDFFRVKYDAYLPLAQPVAASKWLLIKTYAFLFHPLGMQLELRAGYNYHGLRRLLELGWVAVPLIGAGVLALLKHQKTTLLLLGLPVMLALVASGLGQYPFYQRFTLFLVPSVVLILAYGAQWVCTFLALGRRFAYVLQALVLAPGLLNSARQAFDTRSFYNKEYYREVFLYINDHFQAGDAVYVYWNMRMGYDYYKTAYDLRYHAIEGSYAKNRSTSQADYLAHLAPDFAALKGKKRVWLVYDVNNWDPIGTYVNQPAWYHNRAYPPGRLLNEYFAGQGKQVDHYQEKFWATTLYELPR